MLSTKNWNLSQWKNYECFNHFYASCRKMSCPLKFSVRVGLFQNLFLFTRVVGFSQQCNWGLHSTGMALCQWVIGYRRFESTVTSPSIVNRFSHLLTLGRSQYVATKRRDPITRWRNVISRNIRMSQERSQKLRKANISIVLSARISAWNNSAPTVRVCMKFYFWLFFEIGWEDSSFIKIWQK